MFLVVATVATTMCKNGMTVEAFQLNGGFQQKHRFAKITRLFHNQQESNTNYYATNQEEDVYSLQDSSYQQNYYYESRSELTQPGSGSEYERDGSKNDNDNTFLAWSCDNGEEEEYSQEQFHQQEELGSHSMSSMEEQYPSQYQYEEEEEQYQYQYQQQAPSYEQQQQLASEEFNGNQRQRSKQQTPFQRFVKQVSMHVGLPLAFFMMPQAATASTENNNKYSLSRNEGSSGSTLMVASNTADQYRCTCQVIPKGSSNVASAEDGLTSMSSNDDATRSSPMEFVADMTLENTNNNQDLVAETSSPSSSMAVVDSEQPSSQVPEQQVFSDNVAFVTVPAMAIEEGMTATATNEKENVASSDEMTTTTTMQTMTEEPQLTAETVPPVQVEMVTTETQEYGQKEMAPALTDMDSAINQEPLQAQNDPHQDTFLEQMPVRDAAEATTTADASPDEATPMIQQPQENLQMQISDFADAIMDRVASAFRQATDATEIISGATTTAKNTDSIVVGEKEQNELSCLLDAPPSPEDISVLLAYMDEQGEEEQAQVGVLQTNGGAMLASLSEQAAPQDMHMASLYDQPPSDEEIAAVLASSITEDDDADGVAPFATEPSFPEPDVEQRFVEQFAEPQERQEASTMMMASLLDSPPSQQEIDEIMAAQYAYLSSDQQVAEPQETQEASTMMLASLLDSPPSQQEIDETMASQYAYLSSDQPEEEVFVQKDSEEFQEGTNQQQQPMAMLTAEATTISTSTTVGEGQPQEVFVQVQADGDQQLQENTVEQATPPVRDHAQGEPIENWPQVLAQVDRQKQVEEQETPMIQTTTNMEASQDQEKELFVQVQEMDQQQPELLSTQIEADSIVEPVAAMIAQPPVPYDGEQEITMAQTTTDNMAPAEEMFITASFQAKAQQEADLVVTHATTEPVEMPQVQVPVQEEEQQQEPTSGNLMAEATDAEEYNAMEQQFVQTMVQDTEEQSTTTTSEESIWREVQLSLSRSDFQLLKETGFLDALMAQLSSGSMSGQQQQQMVAAVVQLLADFRMEEDIDAAMEATAATMQQQQQPLAFVSAQSEDDFGRPIVPKTFVKFSPEYF